MKTFFCILILFFSFCVSLYAQDEIIKVYNPEEVMMEINENPKEIEGLAWNRWTSKNFVVCSLNDPQAQYLHKHLEVVKTWIYNRWGLEDTDFSVPCKLICVDNKDLFKKLFNIEETKVELRHDSNGRINESVIFLLIDGPPSKTVPVPLSRVCYSEFSQTHTIVFPLWAEIGMSELNGTIDQIKYNIINIKNHLNNEEPIFYSEALLNLNKDQYQQLDLNKKNLFSHSSVLFCLFLRKEFGQDVYLDFIKESFKNSPEFALKNVLRFSDYSHLDKTFKRYMIDLSKDVVGNVTPNSYLQINEPK